jgi:hypothetical protein
MPDSAEGQITAIDAGQNFKIRVPEDQEWPVGTRLNVLDSNGKPILEIKVIDLDVGTVTARYFNPSSAGLAAAVGAVIGSLLLPGIGLAVGAPIGGTFHKMMTTGRIHVGMKVVPAPERPSASPKELYNRALEGREPA